MAHIKHFENSTDPKLHMQIDVKIKANFGLKRIFRWLSTKLPIHGESLILAQILQRATKLNKKFPKRTIQRVIRECEEKFEPQVRRWLLKQGGYK